MRSRAPRRVPTGGGPARRGPRGRDRVEHGKRPGTRQRRQPEKAARDEARRDRPGGAQAADGDHDTAGRERHRECLGVVRPRQPRRARAGATSASASGGALCGRGPSYPPRRSAEHAGRKTGGRRRGVDRAAGRAPTRRTSRGGGDRRRGQTQERRRVPDTGLVLPVAGLGSGRRWPGRRGGAGEGGLARGARYGDRGIPGEVRLVGGREPADR